MNAPLYFSWDGEAMKPLNPRAADKQYVVGLKYRLAIEEERSANSHRHLFATVNEAWRQLPHGMAEEFPTADHLRKRALIDAGFYNQEVIDCGTPEIAERVAAFAGRQDEFAVVAVNGAIVIVRRAKSQSVRSMTKDDFQASKTAVLDILAGVVGVTPAELAANAERAA